MQDTKQNGLAGTLENACFDSFSAHGVYNGKIAICYSQTMHKIVFSKGHRPG